MNISTYQINLLPYNQPIEKCKLCIKNTKVQILALSSGTQHMYCFICLNLTIFICIRVIIFPFIEKICDIVALDRPIKPGASTWTSDQNNWCSQLLCVQSQEVSGPISLYNHKKLKHRVHGSSSRISTNQPANSPIDSQHCKGKIKLHDSARESRKQMMSLETESMSEMKWLRFCIINPSFQERYVPAFSLLRVSDLLVFFAPISSPESNQSNNKRTKELQREQSSRYWCDRSSIKPNWQEKCMLSYHILTEARFYNVTSPNKLRATTSNRLI